MVEELTKNLPDYLVYTHSSLNKSDSATTHNKTNEYTTEKQDNEELKLIDSKQSSNQTRKTKNMDLPQ